MLHLVKAAELGPTYNQLTLVWNQLAVNLRRDIPKPRPITTLRQFFEQVDFKTVIWKELATRQPQRWQNRPALHHSTPDRYTNSQKNAPQQQQPKHRYPYPLPQRIPTNDGKSHAYLVDIDPDGYGIYEDEPGDQDRNAAS